MLSARSKDQLKNIKTLVDAQIPDLATLKDSLPGSILVSLDIESFVGGNTASEIGLAILHDYGQSPPFHDLLARYYYENQVDALNIELIKRGKPKYRDVEYRYGKKVLARHDQVDSILGDMLARYDGKKILVGFAMATEFRWISEECPSLAQQFSAVVDLQELVSQRRRHENLGPKEDIMSPSLTNTLRAMHITDWRAKDRRHCAVNDAIGNLIILSGLVSNVQMDPPPRPQKLHAYSQLKELRKKTTKRFCVEITARDGGKLPIYSPAAIRDLFSKYSGLKAVAVNWRTPHNREVGSRHWALEFRTVELLEEFVRDVDGSVIEDTQVCVVRQHAWKHPDI